MGDPMATGSAEKRHAFTFLWKIEHFGFYEPNIHSAVIQSPYFTSRTPHTRWYLQLYPKGKDKEDERFRIYLHWCCKGTYDKIDCEFSFLGGDGYPLVTRTMRNKDLSMLCSLEVSNCPTHIDVFVYRKSVFLPNDTLTVRCRVWKSVGNFERSECISLRSRLEYSMDSFQWPIKAYSQLPLDKQENTEIHLCIAGRTHVFWIYFYLRGSSLKEAVAQIELDSVPFDSNLSATLKVSILDDEEKAMISVEGKLLLHQSEVNQSCVLPELAKRKNILGASSDCLGGDVLTLLCELTVVLGISHFLNNTNRGLSDLTTDVARNDSISSDASCRSLVTLGEDLMSLYRDHTGSDFELRSGDVSFPVHKQVLMARSPVFRAMLRSDMKESSTNSLEVPDVDAHTLNRMLTFIYSDTMDPELQWEGAARLYYAADKYQVPSLKQRCSSVLQTNVSVSNVSDILTLADRYQDQQLTSCVHHFFLTRFDAILLSEEWYTFMERDPCLAGKTLKKVHQKKLQLRSE